MKQVKPYVATRINTTYCTCWNTRYLKMHLTKVSFNSNVIQLDCRKYCKIDLGQVHCREVIDLGKYVGGAASWKILHSTRHQKIWNRLPMYKEVLWDLFALSMQWLKFDIKFGNRLYSKEKRRAWPGLASYEYNLLTKQVSNFYHYIDQALL